MHAQQHARALVDGGGVVADARAIGGAHFAQDGAAFGANVRDAERVADFDQLAARDDDLIALRQGVEGQEDGGGIVIDHQRPFRTQKPGEEAVRVRIALAALAAGQIVLQIGIPAAASTR